MTLDPHSLAITLAITLARHPVTIRPLTPLDRGPRPSGLAVTLLNRHEAVFAAVLGRGRMAPKQERRA